MDEAYDPGTVAAILRGKINPRCRAILVEHPYTDKDYRSTYYNFYAKKELSLPQFVWIVEISSVDQWKAGQVTTRVVVDATASPYEDDPYFSCTISPVHMCSIVVAITLSP